MQERIEVRKSKGNNYELNLYQGKGKAVYHNILSPDSAKIAMILLDLELMSGLPIFQAVKLYLTKRESPKDWLGL